MKCESRSRRSEEFIRKSKKIAKKIPTQKENVLTLNPNIDFLSFVFHNKMGEMGASWNIYIYK